MIAVLAGNDPLVMDKVFRAVRLRDGLGAYLARLREEAAAGYMHMQILYVNGGLKKAPKMPDILKQRSRRKKGPSEPFKAPDKPAFLTALEEERASRGR